MMKNLQKIWRIIVQGHFKNYKKQNIKKSAVT